MANILHGGKQHVPAAWQTGMAPALVEHMRVSVRRARRLKLLPAGVLTTKRGPARVELAPPGAQAGVRGGLDPDLLDGGRPALCRRAARDGRGPAAGGPAGQAAAGHGAGCAVHPDARQPHLCVRRVHRRAEPRGRLSAEPLPLPRVRFAVPVAPAAASGFLGSVANTRAGAYPETGGGCPTGPC